MSTALPPDEKRQLAALRALLSSEDAANVEQGAHLLAALVGTSVFAFFAAGVGVTDSGELACERGPLVPVRHPKPAYSAVHRSVRGRDVQVVREHQQARRPHGLVGREERVVEALGDPSATPG